MTSHLAAHPTILYGDDVISVEIQGRTDAEMRVAYEIASGETDEDTTLIPVDPATRYLRPHATADEALECCVDIVVSGMTCWCPVAPGAPRLFARWDIVPIHP